MRMLLLLLLPAGIPPTFPERVPTSAHIRSTNAAPSNNATPVAGQI